MNAEKTATLQDFLAAAFNKAVPDDLAFFLEDIAELIFDAFPFVHVDDWTVSKTKHGLEIQGVIGVGQAVSLKIGPKTVKLVAEPEFVEPATLSVTDRDGFIGWFSLAAPAFAGLMKPSRCVVMDVEALRFECRKTGRPQQGGWTGADVEVNARKNTLRIVNGKTGKPMGHWLHPPLQVVPAEGVPTKFGFPPAKPSILSSIGTPGMSWVEACLQLGWVLPSEPAKPKSDDWRLKKAKADPAADDIATMDFGPPPPPSLTGPLNPSQDPLESLWESMKDAEKAGRRIQKDAERPLWDMVRTLLDGKTGF